MITTCEFRERFRNFSDESEYDDFEIETCIDLSIIHIGENELAYRGKVKNYNTLQYYLTAHYLVVSNKQSSGDSSSNKDITSTTAGKVSISYNTNDASNDFMSTSYGQQYLKFSKLFRPFRGFVVGGI